MVTHIESGELRGTIVATEPTIDSPSIYIKTTKRLFAVIRMRYQGEATEAQLLCKGGSVQMSSLHMGAETSNWGFRHLPTSFASSSGNESVHNLMDDNPYTKWTSNQNFSEYVIFDLGNDRWINTLGIQSDGSSSSPQNCILQSSISAGAGPFKTVATFRLSQV